MYPRVVGLLPKSFNIPNALNPPLSKVVNPGPEMGKALPVSAWNP